MAELGDVLPHLIFAVTTAPDANGPVLFSKLDIKDGYWRMVVLLEEEWNFAYVLPKLTRMNLCNSLSHHSCKQDGVIARHTSVRHWRQHRTLLKH